MLYHFDLLYFACFYHDQLFLGSNQAGNRSLRVLVLSCEPCYHYTSYGPNPRAKIADLHFYSLGIEKY